MLGARKAYVYELDRETATMHLHYREEAGPVDQSYPSTRGITGLAITTCAIVNVTKAAMHTSFDAQVDDHAAGPRAVGAIVCAPLMSEDGTVLGAITASTKGADGLAGFAPEDEAALKIASPFITNALRVASLAGRRTLTATANRAISGELEPAQLYTAVSVRACELFGCEACQVFVVDGATGELYLASGSDMTLVTTERSVVSHVVTTGDPVVVPKNASEHAAFNALVDQPKDIVARNLWAMPITSSKQVVGVVELINRKHFPFGHNEDSLLRMFVAQVSECVQNAGLYSKTASSLQAAVSTQAKYQALLEVAEALAVHLEGEGLVAMILSRARELVNAERSALFLIDESTNELVSQVAEGTESGFRFPANQGIAGHVATTGEVQNIDDVYSDKRFNTDIDKITGFKTRNIICVPIKSSDERIIGVTEIINKKAGGFTKEDEELLKVFSIFCGLALHNANLYEEALNQQKKAQALLEVVMALTSDNQVSPLLTTIMQRARELINADRASLFVVDPKNKELRTQVADGAGEIIVPSKPSSIVGYVASTGEQLTIQDAYTDTRFNSGVDRATGYRTHSVLAIPVLNDDGEVIARDGHFKEQDAQLLKAFAAFCGKSLASVSANFNASKKKMQYPVLQPTAEDKALVLGWDFDVNAIDETEHKIRCVMSIFQDFGLFEEFHIDQSVLVNLLHELSKSYNTVPYHNFSHAVDVTQFIYLMLRSSEKLAAVLGKLEILALFISALCHDVDHGGLNNAFQVNAQTPLALLFSNTSVMETYHCSRSIAILSNDSFNILAGLNEADRQAVWGYVIPTILSTDMAMHFSVLAELEAGIKTGKFTCTTVEQKKLMLKVLIKCGDISNVCRPFPLALKWATILLNEFFRQGEIERSKGMKISPFMDPSSVVMSQMQLGFLKSIAFPMFEMLDRFVPDLRPFTLDWGKILADPKNAAPNTARGDSRDDEDIHKSMHGVKLIKERPL
eukprot:m51a1_g12181 hypothetical protein (975) ;mRNA; r:293-4272